MRAAGGSSGGGGGGRDVIMINWVDSWTVHIQYSVYGREESRTCAFELELK